MEDFITAQQKQPMMSVQMPSANDGTKATPCILTQTNGSLTFKSHKE